MAIRVPLRGKTGAGKVALVDEADAALVFGLRWHCNHGYARSNTHKLMHRIIMGLAVDDGREVDHRNHDKLDNRRSNLRIVTTAQNQQNRRGANRKSKSGERGVYWMPGLGRFRVDVRCGGKTHYAGLFTDKAAAVRRAAELRAQLGYITTAA